MKQYLLLAALGLGITINAKAQTAVTPKPTTYIMPDGNILPNGKLDSLNKAWGQVLFSHNEEDDAKGQIHLVKMTDEMKKQFADLEAKRTAAFKTMLNHAAPNFSLTDLSGKKYTLSALKGKVVVLNFWFTSCPPCIQEMPELNKLVQAYDPEKVVFLGLTFNDSKNVKSFLQEHLFNYTLFPSSKLVDKQYQISSWPSSFVINKEGIITLATSSSQTIREDLSSAINAAL